MSQYSNLNNPSATSHRDYGAISTSNLSNASAGASTNIPDVNFCGFSPTEFMSLSEDIAHNIQAVISSSKQLEKILQILGTPRDQQSTRDKVDNIHTKTNIRIETTTVDLERLTAIVGRGDKQQKLQLGKLTNDFRTVVERYSAIQRRIAAAMRQTYSQNQLALMQEDQCVDEENDSAALLQRKKKLEQQQLQYEHDMLIERERQIKHVESKILDSNVIMHKIAKIVQAQNENVGKYDLKWI